MRYGRSEPIAGSQAISRGQHEAPMFPEMFWALLFVLVPLVLFVVVARRIARVFQQIRDPRRVQELLSEETRAALIQAGLDLDSLDLEELQGSEELARRIGADVQRALRTALLGGTAGAPRSAGAATQLPPLGAHPISSASGVSSQQPLLPPPIDQPGGAGLRLVLLALIVGLTAAGVLLLGSR